MSELNPAERACLTAAKTNGLMKFNMPTEVLCPGSAHEGMGWSAQANWSATYPDHRKGGPWSVEFVASLCERGLLGVSHREAAKAVVTVEGKRALRPEPTKALPLSSSEAG